MRRRPRRLSLRMVVTAVAVALGVLSMHAVSGGPHAPRGVEHAMSSGLAAFTAAGTGAHAATSPERLVAQLSPPLQQLAAQDLPTEPSAAMAVMCAAVLLSVVVALGLRVLGRLRGSPAAVPAVRRVTHGSRATRASPPDLLTRLCVLRT